MEEYRKIEGYDNYSVSNRGNVLNNKTGRIIRPSLNGKYLGVSLSKNGKQKSHNIHRLVGLAFLENPDNLSDIDHINQVRTDNRIENLRWCSRENNCRNKKKKEGTSSQFRGVNWDTHYNKWRSMIRLNGKTKHLGLFETEEEAHTRWCECVIENNLQEFYGL